MVAIPAVTAWFMDAADLLAEPDPGPTPWLVENLIVDRAIVAAVGRWKTTKSYGLLDLCISIATGRPAFGHFAIPEPGPVIFINEESGRAALWRRLDALCRGRAINPEELRGKLLLAANARVKLDHPDWQNRLLELGQDVQPRLFAFDPLARMKAASREENSQSDMSTLIDYLRLLRDETDAGSLFVHHTGHQGDNMRGSSDLESAWETRLRWKRDPDSPIVEIVGEHREAEDSPELKYRINWDGPTRSMRFDLQGQPDIPPLEKRVAEWLAQNGPAKTEDVAKGVNTRTADVLRILEQLQKAGNDHGKAHRGPSGRLDRLGRPIRDNAWQWLTHAVDAPSRIWEEMGEAHQEGTCGSVPQSPPIRGDGQEEPPRDPSIDYEANENGAIPPDLFADHEGTPHYTLDDQDADTRPDDNIPF